MKIALTIPGYKIEAPNEVPTGGLSTTGEDILQVGINLLFVAAIIVFLFYFLWGAIRWIASEGDKNKIQMARGKITYSILGLVIVLISFFIINAIGSFFNIKLIGF